MIPLTPEAEAQLDDLLAHFERLERPRASRNLILTLEDAAARIEHAPHEGLPAPRPYPSLARLGFLWTKSGQYWIAHMVLDSGPIIAGVFHDTADIPNRA